MLQNKVYIRATTTKSILSTVVYPEERFIVLVGTKGNI